MMRQNGNAKNSTGASASRMDIDFKQGINGYFDLDGITISVWGSTWSGREVVRIDDRVVSDKRSWRWTTVHEFEHAGNRYRLLFITVSALKGRFRIELYRNSELVDSDECAVQFDEFRDAQGRISFKRIAVRLAPFFVAGLIAGALAARLVESLTQG